MNPSRLRLVGLIVLIQLGLLLTLQTARAASATWSAEPRTKDWNTSGNWTPATVPAGAQDTATFAISNKTGITMSQSFELNGIVFNPGASVYSISTTTTLLTISGTGVVNNSGVTQNISAGTASNGDFGVIYFKNNATAGDSMNYNIQGSGLCDALGGFLEFFDHSSAGMGSAFTTSGGQVTGASGSEIHFFGQSKADHVTFTSNGGTVNQTAGSVVGFGDDTSLTESNVVVNGAPVSGVVGLGSFGYGTTVPIQNVTVTTNGGSGAGSSGGNSYLGSPSAQGCVFVSNGGTASNAGGGATIFYGSFDTGDSTLIANGGTNGGNGGLLILQEGSVVSGRVELFGNGTLDISSHAAPGVSVGSIEGDGVVNLGALNLEVGSSALTTTFSGTVQGAAGSSLTKVGAGTLTLTGSTTFAGGTVVAAGTLGGKATIAGALTIGTGSGAGAFLAPAAGGPTPMTLTTQSALTFKADGSYTCTLSTKRVQADQVSALGVTIVSAAQFKLQALAKKRLTMGQTFVVLNNTSSTAISGTFTNLADGATVKSGNNKFQANYEGGDGNDLTLTVVP